LNDFFCSNLATGGWADGCGGRGVFNRNEANNEVDEPFMKGVDYSDNSKYSLRKRIMLKQKNYSLKQSKMKKANI
jgi:hypothetical protein